MFCIAWTVQRMQGNTNWIYLRFIESLKKSRMDNASHPSWRWRTAQWARLLSIQMSLVHLKWWNWFWLSIFKQCTASPESADRSRTIINCIKAPNIVPHSIWGYWSLLALWCSVHMSSRWTTSFRHILYSICYGSTAFCSFQIYVKLLLQLNSNQALSDIDLKS